MITVPASSTTPSARDEGRRPNRRPRRQADHQRAHRLLACLRPGQEARRERSPSTTWVAAPSTSRILELGEGSSRSSRRTATRTSRRTTSTSGVMDWLLAEFQEGPGHRPARRPAGPLPRQGGGPSRRRSSSRRRCRTEINLPYITADASGPKAPRHDGQPGQARGPRRRPRPEDRRTGASRPSRTPGWPPPRSTRSCSSAGMTRMPAVIEAVKAMFGGKEPNRGFNPDEVGSRSAPPSGRRPGRRRGRTSSSST